MEKMFNLWSIICGCIGGVLTFLFGEFDALLTALIVVVILDYITGLIKGVYTKTLSSEIGFKGLLKKILIFIVVATAVVIQKLINGAVPLREVTIMFFVCNECISLLENAAEFIPIPKKIKEVLLQLRGKIDTVDKSDESEEK